MFAITMGNKLVLRTIQDIFKVTTEKINPLFNMSKLAAGF